jgi:hypothetical protein
MTRHPVTREQAQAWLDPFEETKCYVSPQRIVRDYLALLDSSGAMIQELFTIRTDLRARLTDEENAANPTTRDKIRFLAERGARLTIE